MGGIFGGDINCRRAVAGANDRWEAALLVRNLTDPLYGSWYEPLVGAGINGLLAAIAGASFPNSRLAEFEQKINEGPSK